MLTPVLLVYGAVLFGQRVKNWERGKPDNRATTNKNVKRRLAVQKPQRKVRPEPTSRGVASPRWSHDGDDVTSERPSDAQATEDLIVRMNYPQ